MAALEAVVADRNTLAAQNTQLWKLIEKQRTGYSQLMKELERVRGERDVFRSNLQRMGGDTDALLKAYREKEKREGKESLRSAASHTHLRTSESSGSNGAISLDPRGNMTRTQSDDHSVRSVARSTNGSREVANQAVANGRERQNSQGSLYANQSPAQYPTVYLSALHTPSTSNISTSPTTSIPQSASSSTTSLPERQSTDTARKPSPLHLGSSRSDSLPSSGINSSSGSSSTPQSGSASSSTPSGDDPILGSWNGAYSSRNAVKQVPRASHPSNTIFLTPATPGASSGVLNTGAADDGHPHAEHPMIGSQTPVLDVPGRPQPLSRESRVSLPEEAKRYYATMGESPIPSPRVAQTPNMGSPVVGQMLNSVPSLSESPPPVNEQSSNLAYAKSAEDGGEFLELEDEDSAYESTAGDDTAEQSGDQDDDYEEDPIKPSGGTRAVVEEFPLPPQSPPADSLTQAQIQSIAVQRMQERVADDTQSQYSVMTDSHTLVDARTNPLNAMPVTPLPLLHGDPQMTFRALPLLASDLTRTEIAVSHSSIRANERGREVLSFVIVIRPAGKDPWKVEKLYSDVVTLDSRVRAVLGKSLLKRLANLPEGRLWKDHAPAKVDQRKNALEVYLKSLVALPVKNKDEIIAFFTSDVVREAHKPVSQAGYKEGYLTKRGKNFGGWKTRYFMLQGPSLEYYENRGGTHLGSILITGAQIGRQQKTQDKQQSDEDNDYRHAFLIIEARKGPGGSNPRHVLCAQSDRERDDWVEELVRYVTGTYNDEDGSIQDEPPAQSVAGRSSTSSDLPVTPSRRPRKDDITKGPAVPISQLPPEYVNAKFFSSGPAPSDDSSSTHSPVKTSAASYVEHRAAAAGIETPLSTSLPSSSPLTGAEDVDVYAAFSQRATSEMGQSPDHSRRRDKRRSLNPLRSTPIAERDDSPENDTDPHTPRVDVHGKVKISGPMNGTPIPAGYKFGGKDGPPDPQSSSERREKAKSRTFWGFGRHEKANMPAHTPRNVFGVSLEESLDVAQIASLPAIVFRCIQYLEAKKADQEEGIYRLSGSSAVIKALKDRFNLEGDVDLLASDEYWDPHAIAGLLKTFLRELPASILTRDLHLRFLSVIDFVDPQERITELSHLIASLPVANYSLLRALTAHLILIVQNSNVNKMTMRNVGIVFSPTLGIPAGVFSLMLGEFKRVFNVDGTLEGEEGEGEAVDGEAAAAAELSRRNSRHYSDAAADKLLGLSGRALSASAEDGQSDEGEDVSLPEDSGTEDTAEQDSAVDHSVTSSPVYLLQQAGQADRLHPSDHGQMSSGGRSHASNVAASRGLNISVSASDKASRRQSRVIGLPHSPRPPHNNSTMPGSSPLAPSPSKPSTGCSPHSPVPPSPLQQQQTPK